jgi:hypothetical protein
MKRFIVFLFLSLTFISNAISQTIIHTTEWKELMTSLKNENWQDANTLSLSILNKIPKDGDGDVAAAMLRYMYIFSEAGLMNLNKVTKSEALKCVVGFTGQWVILPSHPISLKRDFNSVRLVNGKTDSLFITSTNVDATSIFSFEYIILDEKWPIDDFKNNVGDRCRLGGTIRSISVEGNMFPRFRITLDHSTARMENK